MKKLGCLYLFILLLNCNKEPDIKIIPKVDFRDNFVGTYQNNGKNKYYSCYGLMGNTGVFDVRNDQPDKVEVQKYDTNGLLFIASTSVFLLKDIGQINTPKIDLNYPDYNYTKDIFYLYLTSDSICLRRAKSFSKTCDNSYSEISASK